MKISEAVKSKLAEVIEIWAEETLDGKPVILALAVYSNMEKLLQDKTDEIVSKFGDNS